MFGTFALSLIQLIIPFAWWKRSGEGEFLDYVGLKKPKLRRSIVVAIFICLILLFISNLNITEYFDDISKERIGEFMGVSLGGPVSEDLKFDGILFMSLITTGVKAFCTYLFTYGFILKRLISKFGKTLGIIINASLFAFLGNFLLIITKISLFAHALFFIIGFLKAILNGALNERVVNGSIIPGIGVEIFGSIIYLFITILA